jgi:galactokinase
MPPADVTQELQEESSAKRAEKVASVTPPDQVVGRQPPSTRSLSTGKPTQKPPEVPKQRREQLRRFKVHFSKEDLRILEKISAARGQKPDDFVRFARLLTPDDWVFNTLYLSKSPARASSI